MQQDLKKIEDSLWEAADQLRANSKLNATEYSMPVLGLIFLRHATNRFEATRAKIQDALPTRGGRTREILSQDFDKEAAIFLPEEAHYDYLADLPESADLGGAINQAMRLIEDQVPDQLDGVLPKEYTKFDKDLLAELVRIFNRDELRNTTNDDLFGRIYEYFLNKFAMSGAQEGGEFFTPPSLVRTIVNFIEPTHGTILDPACGSGGMFVQAAHAISARGQRPASYATFHGREKSETNTRLARMNLAVHGLEGDIQQGNTFYDRWEILIGSCNFVMANPPFNVDMVDPQKCKGDPRLFTERRIPGISGKNKTVSNANYLWIQYFYSYLNDKGRAGFVMAQSATDAGHGERVIREQIIATGDVDIVVAVGTNFFYTRPLPCSLWFFDRGRPLAKRAKILMLDVRSMYRVISRRIRDFSDEQLQNLTAIVWLYRGERERFLGLIETYFRETIDALERLRGELSDLPHLIEHVSGQLEVFRHQTAELDGCPDDVFDTLLLEFREAIDALFKHKRSLLADLEAWKAEYGVGVEGTIEEHRDRHDSFLPFVPKLILLRKQISEVQKLTVRCLDQARMVLGVRTDGPWDGRSAKKLLDGVESSRSRTVSAVHAVQYPFAQISWLRSRFPNAEIADVPGLCKVVTLTEVAAQDYSLTPGRYVGVAPPEPEDEEHIEERLRQVHMELASLNEDAERLAKQLVANFMDILA